MHLAQFAKGGLTFGAARDMALKLRALGGAEFAVDIGGKLLALPLPVVWMSPAAHNAVCLTDHSSLEC
jgi:hypothetical protein